MPKANLKVLMYAAVFLKPHWWRDTLRKDIALAQQQVESRKEWHHSRYAVEDEKENAFCGYMFYQHGCVTFLGLIVGAKIHKKHCCSKFLSNHLVTYVIFITFAAIIPMT